MRAAPTLPTFEDVWRFESLLRAFQRARRAKRGRGGEPAFYRDLEGNLLRLSDELRERTFRPDPYRFFTLWNKKERVVSEASFRDRVVHHSLVAATDPTFEARFIRHSYACRKGKGQHAAVEVVQRMSRAFPYFLKMDVRKYFDRVSHSVLVGILAGAGLDDGTLWLCRTLLDGACVPGTEPGRGLPIGNLTSQVWANVYLDVLDRHVTRDLGHGAWFRYMDDLGAFGHRKEALWRLAADVRRFCADVLGLEIKDEATIVAPVTEGMPWLGFRVFPGLARVDAEGRRRFQRKIAACVGRSATGPDAEAAEVDRGGSLCGHVRLGDTLALRRTTLARLDMASAGV
jgi:hypothetical protein